MREHMRHADRAMSNLEAMPEGFNALRRLFENVQVGVQSNCIPDVVHTVRLSRPQTEQRNAVLIALIHQSLLYRS